MSPELERLFDDLSARFERLREAEEPSARGLFDRGFLERLARLDEDEYRQFKYRLKVEFFQLEALLGKKVRDKLSETELDSLVEAVRADMERAAKLPNRRLGDLLPDAPCGDLLVPGRWHLEEGGLFRMTAEGVPGRRVADCPVYVASGVRDRERRRVTLVLHAKVAGLWAEACVPASATARQLYQAVANLGVLVSDAKALGRYVFEFRELNRRIMPFEDQEAALDGLFDRWADTVAENWKKFSDGVWGQPVDVDGKRCLAVLPAKLEAFLRRHGTDLRSALAAWRDAGLLVARDRLLTVVRFRGRTRRMAVFDMAALFPGGAPEESERSAAGRK